MKTLTRSQLYGFFGIWMIFLIVTVINTSDRLTWTLESFPVFLAMIALYFTHERFSLPRIVLFWIFVHGIVLVFGGYYTYAKVPLGFWMQELMGLSRNPYDRLGHFMQGFVPAMIIREVLFRKVEIKKPGWLFFITLCICMAISEAYEFIEWWTALILNQGADAFLGTQGDPWDTQWDMFMATIGSIAAQLIYYRRQTTSLQSS
jgi:putative membrane protein